MIIKEGYSFFYDGGDAEGRHFALKFLEVALATEGAKPSNDSSTATDGPGHWEDTTQYDAMGNVTVPGERIFIPDAAAARTSTDTSSPATPTNHTTAGSIYLSRDGASATLPNGEVINAGAGGHLELNSDGGLIVTRPAAGYTDADGAVSQITTYSAAGKVTGNVMQQTLPGQSEPLVQGQERVIAYTTTDGNVSTVKAHFQVGVGWVDSGSGERVLGITEIVDNPHLGSLENPTQWNAALTATQASTDTTTDTAASDGSDAHFNHYPAPGDTATPADTQSDTPAPTLEDALIDALSNPALYSNANDILLADAGSALGNGDVLSDAGPGSSLSAQDPASNQPVAPVNTAQAAPETIAITGNTAAPTAPNPTSFDAYLSGAGASLSPAQQATLAAQLDALGLGGAEGAGALSFVPLPGGGVLICNAAGEVVGEMGVAPDGELHLQSQRVNADGSSTAVDLHIAGNGQATSYSPYQLGQVNATLNLIQGLDGLQHWDRMDDLGHFSSVLGLANSINTLSNGSLGNLSSLNTFSSYVGLAQNIEHGNMLGTLSSINGISQISGQGAIDAALNSALGSTGVPYLNIAVALNDFEHHPGQSIGSLVGMYWGPLGSAIGGTIGSLLDAAGVFGDNRPPPPEGATHYEWDADGNIQIRVDFNQAQGGEMAQSTAQSVHSLLQSIVQSINDQTPDTADNVALNPYLLPRVGFSQAGGAWIEMTTPDGGSYREVVQGNNLAQRLFEVLTENGGIAPAWQVQTQLGHMQQLLAEGAGQAEIAAELGAGAGGHAYHGNQAYALEGNAAESADFHTQSFGALVVHLGQLQEEVLGCEAVRSSTQALQDLQDQQAEHAEQTAVQTSTLYRDTEGDGYFEQTQWVSATDAQGNAQGLLVLDYNGNEQIETRDILNLGGNAGQEGNGATDATQATANAHLQRNNVQWLDANGDNVLDASDPAFAAIKLWVDVNQDARLDAGEHADLASLQITSINLRDGAVTYADGHSDALSVTTLQSDTEGLRYTQVQQADAEGNLHTVHAGQMLEHEGYQGQVQVTDQDGIARWGTVREATFEHEALRTGDWEGTAAQATANAAPQASGNECYLFDSGLRIFHAGQLSKMSANSPDWGICA